MRALPAPLSPFVHAAHIPPHPRALHRLLQQLGSGSGSGTPDALARVIGSDPGLAYRVLMAANAARHRSRPETNLEACVRQLGRRLLRTMATALSVRVLFDQPGTRPTAGLDAFSGHAVLMAELAKRLAVECGLERPHVAYLAGLLHDVGMLAQLDTLGAPYARLLDHCRQEAVLAACESDHLAASHAEVGAWLADQWDRTGETGDAVLFHHASADEIATIGILPQIVWLAHAVCIGDLANQPVRNQHLHAVWRRLANAQAEPDLVRLLAVARRTVDTRAGDLMAEGGSQRDSDAVLPHSRSDPGTTPAAARAVEVAVGERALAQALQDELADIADMPELLARLRESAHILFGLGPIHMLLVDHTTGTLRPAVAGEGPPVFTRMPLRLDDARHLAGQALAGNRARASFAASLLSPPDQVLVRALGAGGLLCLPLGTPAGPVGVMVCGLSRRRFATLAGRSESLQRFGQLAGHCIRAWQQADAAGLRRHAAADAGFARFSTLLGGAAAPSLESARARLAGLRDKLDTPAQDGGLAPTLDALRAEIDQVGAIIDRLTREAMPPP